jgi:hypothetical protein
VGVVALQMAHTLHHSRFAAFRADRAHAWNFDVSLLALTAGEPFGESDVAWFQM